MNNRERMAQSSLLLTLAIGASCANEAGSIGPIGPMGEPGVGWVESGNDLYLKKSGNLGIGTDKPTAKLHVKGSVIVDEDASLLTGRGCRSLTLDKPEAGDLGDQLNPLLAKYRCLVVALKKNTTWEWNKRIELEQGQSLRIEGESFVTEGIAVFIRMTRNERQILSGTEYKVTTRVLLDGYAQLRLWGVNLVVATSDSRPLTPYANGGGLITSAGPFNNITLWDTKVTSSEDLIGILDEGTASVNLQGSKIDKDPGAPRDIFAVKAHSAWSTATSFGLIAHVADTLGPGVSYQANPGLLYNPKLP